jgi:hypothetical protein
MPESEADKTRADADTDSFEWLHIYHDYDVDPSLREEPIKYYKRQMFLNMVQSDLQGKDTKLVIPISLLVVVCPALVPLPPFGPQGSHYFLSTAFQGFSAMLGLLAIALVYRLQQMRESQVHALDELKKFLTSLGLTTHSTGAVELWTEATGQLKRQAEKKKAGVNPGFIKYLQVRINYCTRLEFDDSYLRVHSFSLVIPFILLLACTLAGLAFSAVAPSAYPRFGWCFLVGSVWLSILVLLRGATFMRRHFWVRLETAIGDPGLEQLPPDTFPP